MNPTKIAAILISVSLPAGDSLLELQVPAEQARAF